MSPAVTIEYIVDLARKAGQMILEAGAKKKNISEKQSYSDLVTETDVAVEKFLISQISAKFPEHKFYGEETARSDPVGSGPTWLIDPVDGTTNFVHTHPDHAVSIAFALDQQPVMGVVFVPHRDWMFSAEKGKGAKLNGTTIKVAEARPLNKCLVSTGFLVEALHNANSDPSIRKQFKDTLLKNFEALIDNCQDIRRHGSAATDLCMVAAGFTDGYAEAGVHAYDYAGGKIIVEEAGGSVLDFNGEPLKLGSRHCIAMSSLFLSKELGSKLHRYPMLEPDF